MERTAGAVGGSPAHAELTRGSRESHLRAAATLDRVEQRLEASAPRSLALLQGALEAVLADPPLPGLAVGLRRVDRRGDDPAGPIATDPGRSYSGSARRPPAPTIAMPPDCPIDFSDTTAKLPPQECQGALAPALLVTPQEGAKL